MSAFALILSALLPASDVGGIPAKRGVLTRFRHRTSLRQIRRTHAVDVMFGACMRIISPFKVPRDQSHGHPPSPAHAPERSGEREDALGPTRLSPGSRPGSETALGAH